jgi:putative endonuclease
VLFLLSVDEGSDMFICYIPHSKSTGTYYVGSTQDLINRLQEHNAGEGRSTRRGVPWDVIWTEEFEKRSGALAREKQIKARGIRRFLEDVRRSQSG